MTSPTRMENQTKIVLADIFRNLLLQEGADDEVRLHGVHALAYVVGRYGQLKLYFVSSEQENSTYKNDLDN